MSDGRRTIRLGRLTFDLLQALVEAAPNAVSHGELVRRVWGNRPVSSETLSQRVKLLRDALSDDAGDPRYVEVIRGHGHRLIPRVRPVPLGWLSSEAWRHPSFAIALGLAGVGLFAAFSGWRGSGADAPASIAVVPFQVAGGASDEEGFGTDLAEEVIRRLSRVRTLRVFPSSASFPFRDNIAELHATDSGLDASHVLRGFFRRDGGRVWLDARLIECATGHLVWSGVEETGDTGTAWRVLADSVARALALELSPERAVARDHEDVLAQGS